MYVCRLTQAHTGSPSQRRPAALEEGKVKPQGSLHPLHPATPHWPVNSVWWSWQRPSRTSLTCLQRLAVSWTPWKYCHDPRERGKGRSRCRVSVLSSSCWSMSRQTGLWSLYTLTESQSLLRSLSLSLSLPSQPVDWSFHLCRPKDPLKFNKKYQQQVAEMILQSYLVPLIRHLRWLWECHGCFVPAETPLRTRLQIGGEAGPHLAWFWPCSVPSLVQILRISVVLS